LLAYIADDSIIISDILSGESNKIPTEKKPVGKVVWSPDGQMLVFNSYIKEGDQSYFQIILLYPN
jgi:Tol biopolymer transport system component